MTTHLSAKKAGGHSAVGHWRLQRITAVALVPLSVWLILLLSQVLHSSYAQTLVWLSTPVNALALILWTITAFYHAALGLQVVLEDYVASAPRKIALFFSHTFFLLTGLAALAAIVFILSK